MRSRELPHHKTIKQLLEIMQNQGQLIFWHTPNGEKRDKETAKKLASMGVRAGVWDFIIMSRKLAGTVLFAEVKAPDDKNGLSKSQIAFRSDVVVQQVSLWLIWQTVDQAAVDLAELGFDVPKVI